MGTTKIEWATHTLNFVAGCTEASAACDHCYARTMSARLGTMASKPARYDGVTTGHGASAKWTGKINVDPDAMRAGFARLARRREPARVFLGSMTDLFHAMVPRALLFELLDLIAEHRRHAWLLLTKRPARMRKVIMEWCRLRQRDAPSNLWCGVTAENQEQAAVRIPELLHTSAGVRFVSIEPLLGPIDLTPWLHESTCPLPTGGYCGCAPDPDDREVTLDWVIVGGESGAQARPMRRDWARQLRDHCTSPPMAAFHFKQWGEWHPAGGGLPERIGKKAAGRELDGRTHDGLPMLWPPPVSP